jgi:ribosomal protein L14E/L6E/L27E
MPTTVERSKEIEEIDDNKLLVGYKFLYKLPARRPKVKKLAATKRGARRAMRSALKKPAPKK